MPKPSKFALLPQDVKDWLNEELIKRGYGSLVELSKLLAEKGYEIRKSALGIYSKNRKQKLEAISNMREWSRGIIDTIGKDGVDMSLANTAILQQMIFELFSDMDFSMFEELAPEKKMDMFMKLARLQPELSRTFVTLDTYKSQVLEQLKQLEEASKQPNSTLDPKTLETVRETIYGF